MRFISSIKKQEKRKHGLSWMRRILTGIKMYSNPAFIGSKGLMDNFYHFTPPTDFLNNMKNPDMNNFSSIDYVNKDWNNDNDAVLPRYT